jgi:hypothetical protein
VLLDAAARSDDGRVDLTIESGHQHMRELDTFLRKLKGAGLPLTHGFRDKKDLRPLQTADLWAYEAWQRVREQFASKPRGARESSGVLVDEIPKMVVLPLTKASLPVLFERAKRLLNDAST